MPVTGPIANVVQGHADQSVLLRPLQDAGIQIGLNNSREKGKHIEMHTIILAKASLLWQAKKRRFSDFAVDWISRSAGLFTLAVGP